MVTHSRSEVSFVLKLAHIWMADNSVSDYNLGFTWTIYGPASRQGLVARSDVGPPGIQMVAGLILQSGKTFFQGN